MPERLFDPGMQPERTRLAWQRTLLAFLLVLAGTLRALGTDFLIPCAILAVIAVGVVFVVRRRARLTDAALAHRAALPAGAALAVVAGATVALALSAGAVLLLT